MLKSKTALTIGVVTFCLVGLGMVMIYSASSYSAQIHYSDQFFYVKKQAFGLLAGIALFVGACLLDTAILDRFRWVIMGISIALLLLVFVPGVGVESYGAKRWLNLGFTTIQPSEIAKFALVIFIAGYIKDKKCDRWRVIFTTIASGGVVALLLMLEPNMSITVCVVGVVMVMLFVGGMKVKQLLLLAVPLVIGVVVLILVEPYRLQRLMAFLDPWQSPKEEGYQLIQSYYAIGSGGLFGVGLFNSRQKYLFLPFAESDFIFSVICEELGLLGCIVVIGLFLCLIVCGVKVAMSANTPFDCYLSVGVTAVIAIQTLINVAVVSGSIPPTGVPLPYVSAGGSALAVFMSASGILINVARRSKRRFLVGHV